MEKLGIKIEHIFHSCFTLETEKHFLVFDYYTGDIELSKTKNNYVFVTHGHGDHYTPEIFNWEADNIKYILSSDIEVNRDDKTLYIMNPDEILQVDDLKIQTFGSTDLGLSFLINVDGKDIFHAGDLNWWHWKNDSPAEQKEEEIAYKNEIAKIKGKNIHIAFVPVDPRLEENFHLAGEYFINEIHPEYFLPMHFGDKYNTSADFIHKMKDSETTIVEITHKNQVIEL
ncbi:MAG: MBL fold metallo-hydrolase [Tissierellia bacterium]|nr:MBL fold metallo-hydrolase [Tissierellia bacterium]